GEKLFFVNNWEELEARLEQVLSHGLKVILSEMIPGPDTQLASYYTYIDKNGQLLFHFTKRVVRRFPKNNGQGSYHITEWVEEVAEIGKKFFLGVGLRGLGNVEFKKDLRDGQWKIIECNPRFTAAHEQLVRCGMDISLLIYNHLAGRPLP
ncbi:MAG: carboxylate--amine ligase, partial [Calditrichaeota bacterium]|nr:carboxylate--amine ligase [Calditrichota bacterium]